MEGAYPPTSRQPGSPSSSTADPGHFCLPPAPQNELRPLLFPVFVHTYLTLLATSFPLLARSFFVANAPAHHALHAATLSSLASLTTAAHIAASPVARRFKEEKYVVRMSKGGFGLLCGWLGGGGVEGNWEEGASKARGKEAVRSLVNEHIRVDGACSPPLACKPDSG